VDVIIAFFLLARFKTILVPFILVSIVQIGIYTMSLTPTAAAK